MPSFSIALSGLQADSVALNTIGNNLANLNTTAFKKQSTTFEDLFYQQIGTSGSSDTLQQGVGTRVSGTSSSFAQGTLSTTQNATDMALSGNGFFVVRQGGVQALTRAGNFQLDAQGSLTTINGENVMGYAAVNNVVNASGGLTPLALPIGVSEPARATQSFSLTSNLDAGAAVGAQFAAPVTTYDSLGQSHVATVNFTKSSANSWAYSVTLPAGDSTGAPVNNTGTLTFDGTGKLTAPTANVAGISFPGMVDGANALTFNWNLFDAKGNAQVSQASGASSVTASTQDGYASGVYQRFAVDNAGVVSAAFSNGHTATIGQLAIATVTNLDGLTRAGGNDFAVSSASGAATIGSAGVGGRGTIEDDALEQSNVDISTEFSDLIVAQRAFEANSKTVTTFDSVTQQAINMIR